MSKLETNTIDTVSGTTNLVIGSTNSSTVTFESGAATGHMYPAFEAFISANQDISNAVFSKVQANTEVYDTDSMYDNSTNYRFTPTISGKYYVYVNIRVTSSAVPDLLDSFALIYKNGSNYKSAQHDPKNLQSAAQNIFTSAVVDMNGSSDFVEAYAYIQVSSGTPRLAPGTKSTSFGAYRIGD